MQNKIANSLFDNEDITKCMHRKPHSREKRVTEDVTVSIYSAKKEGKLPQITFTLNNDMFELAAGEVGRIGVAPWQNRIYFIPNENKLTSFSGYSTTNKMRKQFRFTASDQHELDTYKRFVGSYDLKFNSDRGLYYIENDEVKA